jgi:hypothetical protein
MIKLTCGSKLTIDSWEGVLAASMPPAGSREEWNALARNGFLVLDLAVVEFADFTTLGRLLIFLDAWVAGGGQAQVRLPSSEPLSVEAESLREFSSQKSLMAENVERNMSRTWRSRANCRVFMKNAGFETALKARHWQDAIKISDELSAELPKIDGSGRLSETPSSDPLPHDLRRIFPFTWIRPPREESLLKSPQFLAAVAGLKTIGLSREDADTVTRTVLAELVANVAQHGRMGQSEPPLALVGAMLLTPETYSSRIDHGVGLLREFGTWAGTENSPVLRLVVGDAGAGLVRTLPPELRTLPPGETAVDDHLTDVQAAIIRAFDRRISSREGTAPRGDAPGLSKVERIVNSYHGAVLVRTEGDVAGLVRSFPEAEPVASGGLTWTPGTVVEATLLTETSMTKSLTRSNPSTPSAFRVTGDLDVTVLTTSLEPSGLQSSDLTLIQASLNRTAGTLSCLVISTEPHSGQPILGDTALYRAVRDVLTAAGGVAHEAAICLVFPGTNQRLLDLAIADLNDHVDPTHPPVLVLAAPNQYHWSGGSPDLRHLLDLLTAQTFEPGLGAHQETVALAKALGPEVDQRPNLFQITEDEVALRLHPADGMAALADWLSDRLRTRILDTFDQFPNQLFVTPTLRVTRSWIDVTRELKEERVLKLAGFLLASLLLKAQITDATRRTVLIQITHLADDIASAVSAALGLGGGFITSENLQDLDHLSTERGRREPPTLILITDLISTADTLRSSVAVLLARGLVPSAILTVVDARAGASADVAPALRLQNAEIPILSLAAVDVGVAGEPPAPEKLHYIHPVLRHPTIGRAPQPQMLLDRHEYVDMLGAASAIRLGHIVRPADRHYSAYVDATLLFAPDLEPSELVSRIVEDLLAQERLSGATPAEATAISIIYPEPSNDALGDVARIVGDCLAKTDGRAVSIFPITRAVMGDRWVYQMDSGIDVRSQHTVILDTGTVSGSTVRQLMHLAAMGRPRLITAMILLNAMMDSDALALQHVRSITASQDDSEAVGGAIPTSVRYLAQTAARSSVATHCPLCDARRRYAPNEYPVPGRLAEHLGWIFRSLEPRSKGHVYEAGARDVFGVSMSQGDCVRYLQWRAALMQARLDTKARMSVADQIRKGLEGEARRADSEALIRLLAAERQWIKEAPLSLLHVRQSVAGIAVGLLSAEASLVDPILRVQAVMVAARSAPEVLLNHVVQIFAANSDQNAVLLQLEAELLLLTRRRPEDLAVDPHQLVSSLADLVTAVQEMLTGTGARDHYEFLIELRFVAELSRRPLAPVPDDPQTAWSALTRYADNLREHNFDSPAWRVETDLEYAGKDPAESRPDPSLSRKHPSSAPTYTTREDWLICSRYIGEEVLPNLGAIAEILGSNTIRQIFPAADRSRWGMVVEGEGNRILDDVTTRLNDLLSQVDQGEAIEEEDRSTLLDDIQWINRMFLLAHPERAQSAFLSQVVSKCPVSLAGVVDNVMRRRSLVAEIDPFPDVRVFCTGSILRDGLTHIISNAFAHGGPATAPRFRLEVEIGPHDVTIVVRNTASIVPDRHRTGGLAFFGRELRRFGGHLDSGPGRQDQWTYQVSIQLQKWIGA